jgi:uncharacterized protein YaaQ
MKHLKILALLFTTFFLFSCGNTGKILSTANEVYKTLNVGITQDEAANGLKEALKNGTGVGTDFLSKTDGFLKNTTYKILFPPEAQKVEQTLRSVGLGNMCDKAIESINRGAEMAVAEAKPVFVNAISAMTISDAINIVTGGNGAGTSYLKRTTSDQLKVKFSPIIQQSLDKVGATRYWTDAITAYNKIPTVQKINPDLNAYVTNKAMEALFNQIELEENKIRQDPLKRTSELLKKVFNHADTQKSK